MMPRIPDYSSRQVGIRPVGTPGISMRAPDASGLAQGLAQVENGIMRRVEEERQKADTAAVMEADNQLSQWQLKTMFDPQAGVYTKKGGNALDVTNQTLDQFEQAQSKISETLKNDAQRERYMQIVASRRQSLTGDLNRYEFGERQRYYDQVDQGQIETAMQGASLYYNEPEKVAYYQNKMAAVLESQAARKGLPAELAQAELLKANSSMSKSVIGRMIDDDPNKAKSYLEQARGAMTGEDQEQVERAIDREFKRREAEARQAQAMARGELASQVQDATAAYLQGLDFASPPSKSAFVASYGAEEGAKRYDDFLKIQSLGSTIRDIATADPEERVRLVKQYNPAQSGVAGEGFAQDLEIYGKLTNVASALGKELQKDPAGYAAKYNPVLAGAMQSLQNGEPGAAETYAAATLAEQERLGVARPRLLTNSQAAAIAAQFGNTEDGGSNAAKLIQQLEQQWGKHWPTVYGQLQSKLPGAALVIGTGIEQSAAAKLAEIAPLKTEELSNGLASTDVSNAKQALNEVMAGFRGTLTQQAGGARTFSTVYEQAQRLALAYMGAGSGPSEAAEKAYKALVDDKYTVKGSWRAPKQLDADAIERGAELVLDQIDPKTLQYAAPTGVSEDFAAERAKAAITKDGYWATLPDESGLALYYGGSAVIDKEGKPITRSWDDLAGEQAANPSAWERFNEARKRMNESAPAGTWNRAQ